MQRVGGGVEPFGREASPPDETLIAFHNCPPPPPKTVSYSTPTSNHLPHVLSVQVSPSLVIPYPSLLVVNLKLSVPVTLV